MRFHKYTFRSTSLWALALASTLFFCSCAERKRPNVLIITIDTLRYDRLGCNGAVLASTPNIDRLAAEGVRLTNAVSAAPITMPAHTSIFTGLLPPAHGVRDNGNYSLSDQAVTLAERLREAGFTTHAIVSALVLNRRYNLSQGFETYDDELWSEDDPKLFMIRERPAPRTAERWVKWFGTWAGTKQKKPFFSWVHFFDPHQPYRAPPSLVARSLGPYEAEVAYVDQSVGKIIETLRNAGELDDTIVLLTADHGESLGEHGEKTHAVFVYDATVHIPMIWRYPAELKPRVFDGPARSIDIVPTLLELLKLPPAKEVQGRSLLDALKGKRSSDLPQYSESLLSEVGFGMAPLFAVRDAGFKFIRAPKPELYNLRNDPRELRNLYDSDRRTAAKLDRELTEILDESNRRALRAAAAPMEHETEQSLQALGYLAPRAQREAMSGIDPKDGMPLYNKLEEARHFAQQKKWGDAEKVLQELIATTPRNVSAINILGLVSLRQGKLDLAKEYYSRSLALDPGQFRVLGILGALQLADADYDGADAYFAGAIAVNPRFAEAWANRGFLRALQGDEKGAEEFYQKGIAADPTFPRVQSRLADLYYERDDFAKALQWYQKVLGSEPNDVRALLQAGNAARRVGEKSEAERYFQKVEALRERWWVPTYNRACLAAVSNEPDKALRLLSAAAEKGLRNRTLVEGDVDLASIHDRPQFKALLSKLQRKGPELDEAFSE